MIVDSGGWRRCFAGCPAHQDPETYGRSDVDIVMHSKDGREVHQGAGHLLRFGESAHPVVWSTTEARWSIDGGTQCLKHDKIECSEPKPCGSSSDQDDPRTWRNSRAEGEAQPPNYKRRQWLGLHASRRNQTPQFALEFRN